MEAKLLGMVSLADLDREAKGLVLVGETFASITRPRAAKGSAPPPHSSRGGTGRSGIGLLNLGCICIVPRQFWDVF